MNMIAYLNLILLLIFESVASSSPFLCIYYKCIHKRILNKINKAAKQPYPGNHIYNSYILFHHYYKKYSQIILKKPHYLFMPENTSLNLQEPLLLSAYNYKSQTEMLVDSFPQKEKVRRQEIANRIEELEHPEISIKDPRFRKADYFWSEAHVPKHIKCRQAQKKKIYEFLVEGLKNKGSRQSLYISGVPGIGKTISVKQTINSFMENQEFDESSYIYIYINAMSLRKQIDIFKTIYNGLMNQKKLRMDSKNAMFLLDDLFRKGIAQTQKGQALVNKTKILVIDQIDYLDTKDHDVLYNIFDWTQNSQSHLVIIAISNTISFPQNLSEKVASRIGDRRLIFTQYNSNQMEIIINERINESGQDLIETQGIQYISKKVTRFSSDVRKILLVLRQSIFIHLKQRKAHSGKSKISLSNIIEAYDQVYEDVYDKQIADMPECYINFLVLLCSYFKKHYYPIALTHLMAIGKKQFKFTQNDIKELVTTFRDMGIITVKFRRTVHKDKNKTVQPHMNEDMIELKLKVESLGSALFRNDIQMLS